MATIAKVGAIEAHIESDVATETTLVVDVLLAMVKDITLPQAET